MLSVLDLFRVGIGPSSSHTVGPMRIARAFLDTLAARGTLDRVASLAIELQGSLALTGRGHGTPRALILGLLGFAPESIDPDEGERAVARTYADSRIALLGRWTVPFAPETDIVFATGRVPNLHPNGLVMRAFEADGALVLEETYFSTGGGFIATRAELESRTFAAGVAVDVPFPFESAADLLAHCERQDASIADIIRANEEVLRPRTETDVRLDGIVAAMNACIDRGLTRTGTLPGSLKVQRRAPGLWKKLNDPAAGVDQEQLFDWLNVYALAVNEENAAGGKVVTAPTNGAAGIVPAVMRHYCSDPPGHATDARTFLLTAGGVGVLYKQRASISGAEMGCQGEVGVACSMAAAGLAAVWGGTPQQVAAAAEIGMEHNLGLTCDPVGGLVQIPCIERNAMGAVKAVNAARLALQAGEAMKVSLDQVIETMRQTGHDMSSKYKETSRGGLAVNVVEC
jgi:L-serine dehydratase